MKDLGWMTEKATKAGSIVCDGCGDDCATGWLLAADECAMSGITGTMQLQLSMSEIYVQYVKNITIT